MRTASCRARRFSARAILMRFSLRRCRAFPDMFSKTRTPVQDRALIAQVRFPGAASRMAFLQLAARRSMRDGLHCLSAAGSRLCHGSLKNGSRSPFAGADSRGPESDRHGEFLAHHFRLTPTTIADIRKERGKIGLFSRKSHKACASKALPADRKEESRIFP